MSENELDFDKSSWLFHLSMRVLIDMKRLKFAECRALHFLFSVGTISQPRCHIPVHRSHDIRLNIVSFSFKFVTSIPLAFFCMSRQLTWLNIHKFLHGSIYLSFFHLFFLCIYSKKKKRAELRKDAGCRKPEASSYASLFSAQILFSLIFSCAASHPHGSITFAWYSTSFLFFFTPLSSRWNPIRQCTRISLSRKAIPESYLLFTVFCCCPVPPQTDR